MRAYVTANVIEIIFYFFAPTKAVDSIHILNFNTFISLKSQ